MKTVGLIIFIFIISGCAQNSTDKYNDERERTIQKWVKLNPQPLTPLIEIGMSFDEVSKISVKAGRGPLIPPKQTEFEDIVVSRTQMDEELQTFGPLARSDKRFGSLNSINFYLFDKKSMTLYSAAEFSRRQIDQKKKEIVESQRAQQASKAAEQERKLFEAKQKDQLIQRNNAIRSSAKNSTIAQALNYVSGFGENADGDTFYYPINYDPSSCILERVSLKKQTAFAEAMEIGAMIMIPGSGKSNIQKVDLNKGNPNAIEFYSRRGHPNPFIEMQTMNSSGNPGTFYISKVEGIGEFECTNCNSNRVRGAWSLIYRECKGDRKAF